MNGMGGSLHPVHGGHWLNHTDEKSHANLMWTLHPSLLALEEPAGASRNLAFQGSGACWLSCGRMKSGSFSNSVELVDQCQANLIFGLLQVNHDYHGDDLSKDMYEVRIDFP